MSQDQTMTLAGALKALGSAFDHIPEPALLWALDHWDVARPALTQVLARCARDPESAGDADMITSYFALHLMAQKRDTGAFALLRSLSKSPEGAPAIFGGGNAMAFTRVMISLFDGDVEALRAIATSPDIDAFVSVSAFETIAYATAAGQLDRAETHAWLAGLPASFDAAGETAAWEGWALAVASLGFDDLMPRVREAFAAIPEGGDDGEEESGIEDIEMIFQMAREETDPLAVFARDGVAPIDDAIVALQRNEEMMMAADEMEGEDDADGPAPIVNEFRDVGRNDPCPCGSGRKFKKCCLAA